MNELAPPSFQLSPLSDRQDVEVLLKPAVIEEEDVVRDARLRLSYARAKVLGVVLNRVNLQSGDYASYYRAYYA